MTRQFGTHFKCRLISDIKKKYLRQWYKTTKCPQYLWFHGRISNTAGVLNSSIVVPSAQMVGGGGKNDVNIKYLYKIKSVVMVRRLLWDIHTKLSTSTHRNLQNLQMYIFFFFFALIETCTLVRKYKNPARSDWKINNNKNILESKVEFTN